MVTTAILPRFVNWVTNQPTTILPGMLDADIAVVANSADKWNPLFFGTPSTGSITRINRLFVGEATLSSGDIGPVTTKDWLESLIPNTTGVAMFCSVDTTGNLGVVGAARASDFRTAFGSSSGGAQGNTGVGYNDDAIGGAIAAGVVGIGVHKSTAVGITLGAQFDIDTTAPVFDINPYFGNPNGSTIACLLTPGAYSTIATTNPSAALVIGNAYAGGPKFRKGMVVFSGALDTSVGDGGGGVAIEMGDGMNCRWMKSDGTLIGEIVGMTSLNGMMITGSNIRFNHPNNWLAPGANAATFTGNLPGTVGGSTVNGWLTLVDNNGTRRYIPFF